MAMSRGKDLKDGGAGGPAGGAPEGAGGGVRGMPRRPEGGHAVRVLSEPSCEWREVAVLPGETVAELEARLGLPRPAVALLPGRGVVGREEDVLGVVPDGGELVLQPQDVTRIPLDELEFWSSGGRKGRRPSPPTPEDVARSRELARMLGVAPGGGEGGR